MPTTAGGFPVPVGADAADVPGDMSDLAVAVRAALDALVPPGTLTATATATAPTDWLLCQGQAVSRTTYAALYAALGGASSPYGQGDGSTTFNVPDLRGRVPVGEDGTAARLTASDALGNSGGAEKHTLTATEMPSHTHDDGTLATSSDGLHGHGINLAGDHVHTGIGSAPNIVMTDGAMINLNQASFGTDVKVPAVQPGHFEAVGNTAFAGQHAHSMTNDGLHSHGVSGATGSAGAGGAHNNMPPYLVVNWMVKT